MDYFHVLLVICVFICSINLILNFFIGLFLVRFQQSIFNVLSSFESFLEFVPPSKDAPTAKSKTWDQKYEEEMAALAERISKNPEL